ncbi:glycosyltransferase family 2 protein, partial [Paratractidigestivibacter faecalis]|uniref:glycosyltransferase family 2 protein n=1 Tax=Paratractidigestivibacter faecalis TaxID=2292441 RepID=UPI003AB68229
MRRPAIVIVTFKRQELLAQLFESIKKLTVPAWRVVVVDKPNEGYGASCNRGIAMARGEWVSIVEPD